ncbi:YdgA family protein [Hafnia paralvei]|nr:YdgA family protein [Hafnia paralvei]
MKKSAVAVAVIVVLGAAWTGASWYTGKLIEQRMTTEVENVNSQINNYFPKAGLKLSYEDYNRHLFSTDVRYILQNDPSFKGEPSLKAGEQIVLKETITHGPFPTAQLKKFNFVPSMASVHTELENTPAVKALFDATKGKSLIDADTRIAYNGDTQSKITLISVDYAKDKISVKFDGAVINADVAKDLSSLKFDMNSDNVAISAPNEMNQQEQITLQGFTIESDSHRGKFDLNIGSQKMNAKHLSVSVDGKESAVLDGFKLDANMGEDDKNLNGVLNYTLDALKISGKDFGQGALTLKFSGVDGKGLKTFASQYNDFINRQLAQGDDLDPDVYQQELAALVEKNMPALLAGNPTLNVQPLSWKTSQGESQFSLDLNLVNPQPQAETTDEPLMLQSIKKLDAKLAISMPMATQLASQAAELEGYNAEDAKRLAGQQIQGISAMGQMFKLTTQKDNMISSSFSYANGQVDLNGTKMPLAQFVGLFGILGGMQDQSEAPAGN